MRRGDFMVTHSGLKFWPLDPRVSDVSIEDIAHHLSMICRYGGAAAKFYSVAEHSVLVSRFVPPEFARHGLLHDAAEAYVGDMVRPLKHLPAMTRYVEVEKLVQLTINSRFKLFWDATAKHAVEVIDRRICSDEVEALEMGDDVLRWDKNPLGVRVHGWYPGPAREIFLQRYRELFAS